MPWCNQKVNDFWYQFDASIFIIFLLLSSIPCFLKCTTFGHIKKERCLTKFCRIKKAFRIVIDKNCVDLKSNLSVETSCLQKKFVWSSYVLYSHQKIMYLLHKQVPFCNQKMNDYKTCLSLMKKILRHPAPLFAQILGSSKTEILNNILQKIKNNQNLLRQKLCWS